MGVAQRLSPLISHRLDELEQPDGCVCSRRPGGWSSAAAAAQGNLVARGKGRRQRDGIGSASIVVLQLTYCQLLVAQRFYVNPPADRLQQGPEPFHSHLVYYLLSGGAKLRAAASSRSPHGSRASACSPLRRRGTPPRRGVTANVRAGSQASQVQALLRKRHQRRQARCRQPCPGRGAFMGLIRSSRAT